MIHKRKKKEKKRSKQKISQHPCHSTLVVSTYHTSAAAASLASILVRSFLLCWDLLQVVVVVLPAISASPLQDNHYQGKGEKTHLLLVLVLVRALLRHHWAVPRSLENFWFCLSTYIQQESSCQLSSTS